MHRPTLLYTLSCALCLVFATACDPPDDGIEMPDDESYPEDLADAPDEPDERPPPKPNHLKDLTSATASQHAHGDFADAPHDPDEHPPHDLADAEHSPTDPPRPDHPEDITNQ